MLPAGREPLQLLRGELSDGIAPLFRTPSGKRLVGPLKVGKVDMRRDCPPDREAIRVSVNNPEKPVSVFDFDWLCDENLCGKHTPHCPPLHSLPHVPERGQSEPDKLNKGKTLTHLGLRYLQTVVSKRQAAPSVASSNAVGLTTPANDNAPDRDAKAA